ncbi:MAG: histidine kinase [Sphingomonas bacterium]|nr:histidine kinase [Sphingomonas bacterium]
MCVVCVRSSTEVEALLGLPSGDLRTWTQGLLITDASASDNPIVFANHAFEVLTGYAHDEAIGKNCRFLQGPGTDIMTVAKIREAVAEHRRFDGDILNYRKDGTPFWNRLAIGPVRTNSGEHRYFVGMQMDVSHEHAAHVTARDLRKA